MTIFCLVAALVQGAPAPDDDVATIPAAPANPETLPALVPGTPVTLPLPIGGQPVATLPGLLNPVQTLPAPVEVKPSCRVVTETIESQSCTPRPERLCETKQVVNQHITYEKKCKDVVSRHCGPVAAPIGTTVLLKKREAEAESNPDAEADPQIYGVPAVGVPAAVGVAGVPAVQTVHVAAPQPVVTTTTTKVAQTCQEVTQQHCVDNPVPVEQLTPVEQCTTVQKVDCVPIVQEIPKTICDPVETTVVHQEVTNPFAYAIAK